MKKKLLFLGLCIVISASAIANGECTQSGGCPLSEVIGNECYDKIYTPAIAKPCAMIKNSSKCCAKNYQKYVNKIKRERATVYNALDLTEEQIKQREEIVKANTPIYEEKFDQLMKESKKLYTLKKAEAKKSVISKQKKVVKNIKKDIEKLVEKEDRAYKKCLTREQRSKYAIIKKLERKDYNDSLKEKDLYKKNPKMKPFGNPAPCSKCGEEK